MTITMDRAELSSKIQAIGKVISAKNVSPILNDFLFEVANYTMRITASDMETTITTSISVTTDTIDNDELHIDFTVDAQLMMGIVKALNCENVSIDIDDVSNAVVINHATGVYNLTIQREFKYPKPKQMAHELIKFAVDPAIIRNGISRTAFATHNNVNFAALTGINIAIENETLSFAATDRYKIASIDNIISNTSVSGSFIIKAKAALIIKDILSKAKNIVDISFDDTAATFEIVEFTIHTRTIADKFPNYKGIMNRKDGVNLIVDRFALTAAVERVSLCISKASYLIRMDLSNSIMYVSAQDDDYKRSAKEKLLCSYDGTDMSLGLLLGDLLEILKNIHSEEVVFKIASPNHGYIIVPNQNYDNETLVMMIMPLNLGK